MRAATVVSLVFAATLYFSIISMVDSRASWYCDECKSEAECDMEPAEFCGWGEYRNGCKRRVCAKGPGERCGGHRHIMGQCGSGMWCHVDEDQHQRCYGCYDNTLECYHGARYLD